MQIDSHTIDRIVVGVLNQLAADGEGAGVGVAAETQSRGASAENPSRRDAMRDDRGGMTSIVANVITEAVLLEALNGASRIVVPERAIITPAARDAANERGVRVIRQSPRATHRGSESSTSTSHQQIRTHAALPVGFEALLVVVRSTEAVERLWDDLKRTWRRELFGCPDDAAELATSAICRGETSTVVILTEQTHRAACLANRNETLQAVAIRDAGEVRSIKHQLRANVWCLDPTGQSWFELRNLMRAITHN